MFSPDEIAALVLEHYALQVSVKPLPGELDLNFYLVDKQKRKLILKIANRNEELRNLELQNAMMEHLLSKHTSLLVPELIPSRSGENIVTIEDRHNNKRFMRLLTWIDGRPWAQVKPHSPELLYRLGEMCGILSKSLGDFGHPAAHRFLKWNPSEGAWVKDKLGLFDGARLQLAKHFYQLFESAQPILAKLRQSVTYHDANDYNILVSDDLQNPSVPGVIDFGDATYTHTINELAIAIAYGVMGKPDPLSAACQIVRGYNETFSINDDELKVLFPLVCTRLLISVTCSAINLSENPDNVYLQVSDKPAWDLLRKFHAIHPHFAYYRFREVCGMEPCPLHSKFLKWVPAQSFAPIIKSDLTKAKVLDLSVGSLELGNSENIESIPKLEKKINKLLEESGSSVGIGKYNEVRPLYTSDIFATTGNDGPTWRTVHIGMDIFAEAGSELFAPYAGRIASVANNDNERDYGPTLILEHAADDGLVFYTLYGHLSLKSIEGKAEGQLVEKGASIGWIGKPDENGHWPPHLHFQVMLDRMGYTHDFPGVTYFAERNTWTSICPDPALLVGINSGSADIESEEEILTYRKDHLGKNLSVSYKKPLHIARGWGVHLIDSTGRRFLDTVNNVAHVGHEHPRVVRAGQNQMAVLNTNTRYLHRNIIEFTEAVLQTMPAELCVAFLVNSGSEANELALRLARNHTQAKDTVVVETGYHGNTNACVEVSSYKFDGPGGSGAPSFVHVVPMPDTFRGEFKAEDRDAGKKYGAYVKHAVEKIKSEGRKVSAFICESVLSCGGQIPLPYGYLREAYHHIRSAGGVCIADEVQTGCGRAGDYFWAFEQQQVVPDIVTIGKPIGNGHPLAVVVTTQAIADSFANGMEYFNTFGGNPVSAAIGLEVLRVINDEGLQKNAKVTGAYLTHQLEDLKQSFPVIGDVRGPGLFIGIELIEDTTLKPATSKASYLANRMRELGILMSTDGPYNNVIKIKPPLVFGEQHADLLIQSLERVLKEDFMQV